MKHLLLEFGLPLLFLLVAVEGMGIPLPGELTLITTGVLASQGHYSIAVVVVVASAAAITGDNTGYWLGRKVGRRFLSRIPVVKDHFERALVPAGRYFAKHGAKTVFVARFVVVLRFTAGWIAGLTRMRYWRFLLFDALGGTAWATTYGLVSYYSGMAAADAIQHDGFYAAIGIVLVIVIGFFVFKFIEKRSTSHE
jgi:membrane protein DedA with SNARE-associated domain